MDFLIFGIVLAFTALLLLALDYLRECGLFSPCHTVAGRLVVLTGAAGGLGRALALEFARRGAVLVLWDVRADALDDMTEWLVREHGIPRGSLHANVVDVTDAKAVLAAARMLPSTLGAVRVVISNAAVVTGASVLDASVARLRTSLDVNVLSHFWLAKTFLPQMVASGETSSKRQRHPAETSPGDAYSSFVTIGSLMADLPAARLADYSASKAAVAQLHECLRWELSAACRQASDGSTTSESCGRVTRPPHLLHVQPYMIDHADSPLFAGGAPLKYAWLRPLVPPLRARTVARRVLRAVEAGAPERMVLPYIFKWLAPTLSWLPTPLRDALLDLAGAECAMEAFVGPRPECVPSSSASSSSRRVSRSPARKAAKR